MLLGGFKGIPRPKGCPYPSDWKRDVEFLSQQSLLLGFRSKGQEDMHSQAVHTLHLLKSTLCIVAALFLVIWGSASSGAESNDPALLQKSATRILENIIQSVFEGDYALYTHDFSAMMKKTQDRDAFLLLQRNLQKALGKFKSVEYLGSYQQVGQIITLFKGHFTKEKDDVLIKLVLEEDGRAFRVTGLWFDAPSLEK
jgi:hypothetical protein